MTRVPRIGLSANFFHADHERPVYKGKTLLYLDEAMSHWVSSGGALTYLIPTTGHVGPGVEELAHDLDGLVLQGGADVCPRTYGEEPMHADWCGDEVRDRYEVALIQSFLEAGKPVLGVCRGHQMINVALGGTLYQDVTTQLEGALVHRDWEPYDANRHTIDLVPGSRLAKLYPGTDRAVVNSVHHQSVKDLAHGLAIEARATDDGIIEALRLDDDGAYLVGVQWHPEWMPAAGDGDHDDLLPSAPLLEEFLARAGEVARR